MRFDKITPCPALAPYVQYFVVAETTEAQTYKVLPSAGLVLGFQYRGRLDIMDGRVATALAPAGITGINDRFRLFSNSPHIGSILVYLRATGLTAFSSCPAHELFNQSISLDSLFPRSDVERVEEQLVLATTDSQRIHIAEAFLLSRLQLPQQDRLVQEAVRMIVHAKGMIRVKALHEQLYTSASPFEKRFRSAVGTTAKKFAAIVRFNTLLHHLDGQSAAIYYDYDYFDQAHFIKDFSKFTGESPEQFRRHLK